jgi:hypothetical protein
LIIGTNNVGFPSNKSFEPGVPTFMKIYASLDFNKSLLDFQETSTTDLTKTEWNGQILKEREEEIRQAALILAGQCIALLIYNLSQSEEAHHTAFAQTQGLWHSEMQRHGHKKRQILTIENVVLTSSSSIYLNKNRK